jgi:uncharacterized protein
MSYESGRPGVRAKKQKAKLRRFLFYFYLLLFAFFLFPSFKNSAEPAIAKKLRLLIVTGGHDFEEEAFFRVFNEMEGISWVHVRYQQDAERNLKPENSGTYDVAVFYDMNQNYEPHYQDWLKVLEKGKPTVFLHHALGSNPTWDLYGEIIGGRANFAGKAVNGTPKSTFQHDVSFRVNIADPDHPITKGLRDFEIFDETYNHYLVNPSVHVLLTTDHPTSEKIIGWTHRYKNSPIVYLQLGHGPSAYENPNFRTLVARSIRWVASQSQLGK